MNAPTLTHNGIDITITPSGQFVAVKNGERIVAPSLQAIKKKLDGRGKFVSFVALKPQSYYSDSLKEITVIGIKEPRANSSSWRQKRKWKLADGNTADFVYENSEENIQAYSAWKALLKKHSVEREALQKAQGEAEAVLEEKLKKLAP